MLILPSSKSLRGSNANQGGHEPVEYVFSYYHRAFVSCDLPSSSSDTALLCNLYLKHFPTYLSSTILVLFPVPFLSIPDTDTIQLQHCQQVKEYGQKFPQAWGRGQLNLSPHQLLLHLSRMI